jgi:Cu2+-exporting ATPase
MTRCFHCNEPLQGSTLMAQIDGRTQAVCCHGCLAVAEMIAGSGLMDYYRLREAPGAKPDPAAAGDDRWAALSHLEVAAQFTGSAGELDSATLAIDGMRCAACSWLIDRALQRVPGIAHASTNSATARTRVSWRRDQRSLADVARTIAQLGYVPHPLNSAGALELQQAERRAALKRLMVAGFGMMQVMMFAVAAYSADLAGEVMDAPLLQYFRIVSMLVATPVVFYCGAPILAGAIRTLQTRTIGMDLPVAVALLLAYCASLWNTLRGSGTVVYFDSVTMFIFFITLGRFVQMSVRHRTTGVTDALARQLPVSAHRMIRNEVQDVPLAALRRDDVVLVRPGEVLPADGDLLDAEASIDESLLTGESVAVRKRSGDRLAAGALNVGAAFRLNITAIAGDTTLSHIVSLLQRAQTQRPRLSKAADLAAARFLQLVLVGAGLTCASWLAADPARAFPATLAVLVVACPCAFAIAMPAAISAATAQLARYGLLLTRIDALETLARIDRVVFDKTGTLTHGDIAVGRCVTLGRHGEYGCLRIAAALELASEHPLARAFARFGNSMRAADVRTVAGAGLEGTIDGHVYRIGTREFVAALSGAPASADATRLTGTVVSLGDVQGELALFELQDVPRLSARFAVAGLRELGISTEILSGDDRPAVAALAAHCAIDQYFDRQSPEQKLAHVQRLQADGHRVAMIGDGINDAPVLAAADISIAMGRGAALAHASADMVLIGDDLACLPAAIRLARRTLQIARQNLIWSAVYNFGSLPLAAFGLIPPWIAALGMSLSSIAVVLNAARLLPRAESGDAARATLHPVLS